MKAVRSATAAIIFLALIITAGCSDEILSPAGRPGEKKVNSKTNPESSEDIQRFHSNISLKPNDVFIYSYENTGYYKFNSISILNCGNTKGSLEISGYYDDQAIMLGCNSNGFEAYAINIVNTTGETVNLDVFLSGTKTRTIKNNPLNKNEF